MTAEIISVGTELLLGNILNTNAQYLSRELAALGITVQRESTIGDNHSRLADFVNEAKQRCDLLVFTGRSHRCFASLTKSARRSWLSPMVLSRWTVMPRAASSRLRYWALVLRMLPSSSSVPTLMISAVMAFTPQIRPDR